MEPQTPEAMLQWANLKETKAFQAALEERELGIMEDWSNEVFVAEAADVTLQKNAAALGRIQAIQDIIDSITILREEPADED